MGRDGCEYTRAAGSLTLSRAADFGGVVYLCVGVREEEVSETASTVWRRLWREETYLEIAVSVVRGDDLRGDVESVWRGNEASEAQRGGDVVDGRRRRRRRRRRGITTRRIPDIPGRVAVTALALAAGATFAHIFETVHQFGCFTVTRVRIHGS